MTQKSPWPKLQISIPPGFLNLGDASCTVIFMVDLAIEPLTVSLQFYTGGFALGPTLALHLVLRRGFESGTGRFAYTISVVPHGAGALGLAYDKL